MAHKCNRDDCPPRNVNGPKIKCAKCGNLTYLNCFGMEKVENIENTEVTKMLLPNGASFFAFVQHCVFVCCDDKMSSVDLKKKMKLPKAPRAQSKSRQTTENIDISTVLNELATVKELITQTKAKTESIDEKTTVIYRATDVLVGKATRPALLQRNEKQMLTPKTVNLIESQSSSTPQINLTPKQSFATVLRKNQSAKRARIENPVKKINMQVKTGTKVGPCSLSVAIKKPNEKPKFEKAVWVSRFKPEVTCEQVTELVMENTSITDKKRINVHKLIKKERDLTTLKFVSFKIESNIDDFAILSDPNVWPENIMVRPFLQDLTMGDYLFPALNPKTTTEEMETNQMNSPISQSKQPPTISPKQSNKSPTQIITETV